MSVLLLPSELLELIGCYISNQQQYKCLLVCKSWYDPFRRSLYKDIYINTRHQFKLLLGELKSQGLLVRSVSFRKSKNRVGVTSNELDQLAVVCPYLEVLDFDQAVWKYIHTSCNLDQFTYVHRLPPFTLVKSIPNQIERLDRLSLHGAIVSDLFQQHNIMTILKNTPRLCYLSLNSQQDKSHAIYISISEMDAIHDFCPLLQELVLLGSFKLMHAPHITQQIQVPEKSNFMRRFSLNALLAPHWIYYFAYKYPHLQNIDFELMNDTKAIAMPKNKIQKLFSVLLDSCPQLRKIELDSLSAKTYFTSDFFDTADKHGLKEIKMKDLPYCLVSRQDDFFDFVVNRGKKWISGLGTEVIGSDLHITRILQPLAKLERLTELVLCCGHPYFDCELDLVLDHCPNLIQLTIRSAHVTLSDTRQQQQQQHGLKSLSFSTVSFSSAVFDYLATRCDSLTTLVCYECDQKQGNVIRMHMPQHTFETVIINGIRMGSFDQPNARIMSITQGEKSRWYHAYHRNNTCSPKMRRLNHGQTKLAQRYYDQQQQPLLSQVWHQDLYLGYISIQCKSIKHWEFICDTTFEF